MTDSSDNMGDSTAIRQEQGLVKRQPVPWLHVVLFEPEIAANTGAIGRTCVAAGARLWLVRPLGFHLDDRHLRRAGLDYWEHLDLCVVDELGEVAESLGRNRLWSFSTKADLLYTEAVFQPGDAFVFGPESRGLPAVVAGRVPGSLAANPDPARSAQLEPGERRGDRSFRGDSPVGAEAGVGVHG